MNRKTMLAFLLVLMATGAQAAPNGKGDGFWSNLLQKLQKVTPTRKSTATTAVGGIRGAKNDGAKDIYWKGKERTVEVGEDELAKFALAVETRTKGDEAQALKHFEEFLKEYPKSSLRGDCLQAVEHLRAGLNQAAAHPALPTTAASQAPAVPAPQ